MSTERAKRFNEGKPPLSRILEFKGAIGGIARIMAFGDVKYGRLNWQNGLPHTEVADSLLRHLTAWMCGEDFDPESGELHLDHVCTNAMFLAYFTRYCRQFDDRSSTPPLDPAIDPAPEAAPDRAGGPGRGLSPGPGATIAGPVLDPMESFSFEKLVKALGPVTGGQG